MKNIFLVRSSQTSIAITIVLLWIGQAIPDEAQTKDWKTEWLVRDGFSIAKDSSGYHFPTAIAFVPNPGKNPKDPLYFVTELRGKIKVVTNDRSVFTFAEKFFNLEARKELPSHKGEVGLAGICLAPSQGYVFVTFAYHDKNKVLRNNLVRFETKPETFALKSRATSAFTTIFSDFRSAVSHQIGPCQVENELLYVSVGDGIQTIESQRTDSILGKVIRMTLDGKPVPDNPFYQDSDVMSPANYVWVYGLRNPFGLKIEQGRVFVADNGPAVDRFLEVREGENYLWDGSEWSLGTNADVVFGTAVSPVQMDYYPEGSTLFPKQYRNRFYVAMSGSPKQYGPGEGGQKSIVMLNYDFERSKMRSTPKTFLKYNGPGHGMIVGLGFGADGLYFVPLFPDETGETAVIKVTYEPENEHPYTLTKELNPIHLIVEKGCLGCHNLEDKEGKFGPSLDTKGLVERLGKRLNSKEYIEELKEIESMTVEPYNKFVKERQSIIKTKGMEKIRLWVKYQILEPRFDDPFSQMPNLGVTATQAQVIADYLLLDREDKKNAMVAFISKIFSKPKYGYILIALVIGFAIVVLLFFRKKVR